MKMSAYPMTAESKAGQCEIKNWNVGQVWLPSQQVQIRLTFQL